MTAAWILLACSALADPPQADEPVPAVDPLEVHLLAGAWFARLGGNVERPDGAGEIGLDTQFNLDRQEPSPNVELTIRKSEFWALTFSGFGFETRNDAPFAGSGTYAGIVLNPGDPISARFNLTSLALELAVTEWRPLATGHSRAQGAANVNWQGDYIADITFSPVFGMRWVEVQQDLVAPGGTDSFTGDWASAYVGIDFALTYHPEQSIPAFHMLEIHGSAAGGPALGGDGGYMWHVRAGFTWYPIEQFGITIGYRLVELNVSDDDYALHGGLQGLFIAGSLRF